MKPNGAIWRHGRARLDLTAEDAAKRLYISHRYLWNIESEQPAATPSMRLVYRAAELYGVNYEDLVQGDDEKPTEQPKPDPVKEQRPTDPSGPPARPDRSKKGPPRTADDLRAAS